MAQKEDPLYDFPEPTQAPGRKQLWHQRGRGSLRSISVLDRLLLTVPVWLQLSINPATALHILQREPPGTFLVRRSRTSQRNVLCVRLADDSLPSFVQQFGIREDQSTLSLETSAISFPDLPRLISFYCVSRDVLPFPLELPEAIARATSHKELESISHMGVEFWCSHVNVRGPREAPKPRRDEEKGPDAAASGPPAARQPSSGTQPASAPHPSSERLLNAPPESEPAAKQPDPNPTLFDEFCRITTRSPRELDCGSGLGALCFINPLFLQSQNALSRRRMFKRSLKIRVSTETSTMLSPPLAPPPPPPLMPKTKGRCKAQKGRQGPEVPAKEAEACQTARQPRTQEAPGEEQAQPPSETPPVQAEKQEHGSAERETSRVKARGTGQKAAAQLPALMEHLQTDYSKPSLVINFPTSPSLSPYQSPSVSPMAPPLFPKMYPSLSPRDSPAGSPSLSPYQSPSLSPKVPFSLSPQDSPTHSSSPSPDSSFSVSPLLCPLVEQASRAPGAPPGTELQGSEGGGDGEVSDRDENMSKDGESEDLQTDREVESCSSVSNPEESAPDSLSTRAAGTSR
ncbi:unnamed protein product [Menidia menidia]|uniref:(Atlantic silverside) hypothetical protein n=1 Tax=Menidia menidia TaxID=238744 RepID=A0A8S4AMT5_9TELE|nr:unnamed protein product [Menidia menidia]